MVWRRITEKEHISLSIQACNLFSDRNTLLATVVNLLEIAIITWQKLNGDIKDSKKSYRMKLRNRNYGRHLCSSSNHNPSTRINRAGRSTSHWGIIRLPNTIWLSKHLYQYWLYSKLPKAVVIVAVPLDILSHKNIRSLFLLVNFPRIMPKSYPF